MNIDKDNYHLSKIFLGKPRISPHLCKGLRSLHPRSQGPFCGKFRDELNDSDSDEDRGIPWDSVSTRVLCRRGQPFQPFQPFPLGLKDFIYFIFSFTPHPIFRQNVILIIPTITEMFEIVWRQASASSTSCVFFVPSVVLKNSIELQFHGVFFKWLLKDGISPHIVSSSLVQPQDDGSNMRAKTKGKAKRPSIQISKSLVTLVPKSRDGMPTVRLFGRQKVRDKKRILGTDTVFGARYVEPVR